VSGLNINSQPDWGSSNAIVIAIVVIFLKSGTGKGFAYLKYKHNTL